LGWNRSAKATARSSAKVWRFSIGMRIKRFHSFGT
jgi:hypothetical protein